MRVIAGSARSLKLVTVDSNDTRPTTDRIKETLFNMINPYIPGCSFLDIFSGSGAIGIEALSRGAERAVFVENSRKAVACINKNLDFTKLSKRARVISQDAVAAIDTLERQKEAFDIIFMDPPYGKLLEKNVLTRLAQSSVLDENTTVIVESDQSTDFDYLDSLGLEAYKVKTYKTNKHTFICRRVDDE
ncbi:MAG: 16S rRNA (guanine(966)-N(2))-methyltransferase RsmD [Coprococcus sp.]|nr:16S rRNA (guanine(966)-N(2))-methyltransferase RsmD [Coprococcus sp.]